MDYINLGRAILREARRLHKRHKRAHSSAAQNGMNGDVLALSAVEVETTDSQNAMIFHESWRHIKQHRPGSETPPNYEDFVWEDHHRSYGHPWCVGRAYFDAMIHFGLRSDHRILDFGCGAGRLGIWAAKYLDAGCYYGIDPDAKALFAFAMYEVPLHNLNEKRPRLLCDSDFAVEHFNTTFDVVTDLFVTYHFSADRVASAYSRIVPHLSPDGQILIPHKPKLDAERLASLGLVVALNERRAVDMLTGTSFEAKKLSCDWHVLRRLS